jgi:hypothetical protein
MVAGMANVNQTRPHCVNQMGKTHSKILAARHGHGMLCVNPPQGFKMCLSHLIYTVRPCLIHKNVKCESDTAALCKSNGERHILKS